MPIRRRFRVPFSATIRDERFAFADLRELFAKANEEKSGDALAGIGARTDRERVAAKIALADVPLARDRGPAAHRPRWRRCLPPILRRARPVGF